MVTSTIGGHGSVRGWRWPGQLARDVPDGNQDPTATSLRYPILGCVQYTVRGRIGGQFSVGLQEMDQFRELCRFLKLRHVFHDERPRPKRADCIEVVLPQTVESGSGQVVGS